MTFFLKLTTKPLYLGASEIVLKDGILAVYKKNAVTHNVDGDIQEVFDKRSPSVRCGADRSPHKNYDKTGHTWTNRLSIITY